MQRKMLIHILWNVSNLERASSNLISLDINLSSQLSKMMLNVFCTFNKLSDILSGKEQSDDHYHRVMVNHDILNL
jgi:hypothetical protein